MPDPRRPQSPRPPKDDSGYRMRGGIKQEIHENDLAFNQRAIDGLGSRLSVLENISSTPPTPTLSITHDATTINNVSEIQITGMAIITDLGSGVVSIEFPLPVQTLELSVQINSANEHVRTSIVPYDVTWADQYRYVINNVKDAGNFQARYHDGTIWQNVGTSYAVPAGTDDGLSAVSEWLDIPTAWFDVGDAFCQVACSDEPNSGIDVPYAALQFRRSCSLATTLDTIPSCGTVTITNTGTISTEGIPEFGKTPIEAPPP